MSTITAVSQETDYKSKQNSTDRVRRQLLDGLMSSDTTALERSLYRTRLYAGRENPLGSWVQRAHASLRERGGFWGVPVEEAHGLPLSGEFSRAHKSLSEKGLWECRRKQVGRVSDGPGTPYETRLLDAYSGDAPGALTDLAYAAIKSLSLHISPLGPEREDALCRCWYLAGADGTIAGSRTEWKQWLGLRSERGAMNWLRDIAGADTGLTLAERQLPGEKAKLWVVSLRLPPLDKMILPMGAQLHEAERAEIEKFCAYLRAHEPDLAQQAASIPTSAPAAPKLNGNKRVIPSVPVVGSGFLGYRETAEDLPACFDDAVPEALPPAEQPEPRSEEQADSSDAWMEQFGIELEVK